jgi:hypothetical protein
MPGQSCLNKKLRSYIKMTYCWEIYNNSKCETCKHYLAYQNGELDIEKVKDIVVVDED